ncbi:uncharacterized protein METZ01_LOCUS260234, partial [marine metagenome]
MPHSKARSSTKEQWPRIRKRSGKKGLTFLVDTLDRIKHPETGLPDRIRQTFKTRAEAEVFAESLRIRLTNQGLQGFSLGQADLLDAERALKILNGKGVTLVDAAHCAMRYLVSCPEDKTVAEVVEEFISSKENVSPAGKPPVKPATITNYKSRLGWYKEACGDMLIKQVTEEVVHDWVVSRNTPRSNIQNLRPVKTLLQYATDKKYIPG